MNKLEFKCYFTLDELREILYAIKNREKRCAAIIEEGFDGTILKKAIDTHKGMYARLLLYIEKAKK